MIDEVNGALQVYEQKWRRLLGGRVNKTFFEGLRPTAVGWKVEDRAEYDRRVAELHDSANLVVENWLNGRWIAKVHLKDDKLANGVKILKIMQRRPGSTDATGLDHIDFYTMSTLAESREVLAAEPNLDWSEETNDVLNGHDWLSVWFDNTEAKVKTETILDIISIELGMLNQAVIGL